MRKRYQIRGKGGGYWSRRRHRYTLSSPQSRRKRQLDQRRLLNCPSVHCLRSRIGRFCKLGGQGGWERRGDYRSVEDSGIDGVEESHCGAKYEGVIELELEPERGGWVEVYECLELGGVAVGGCDGGDEGGDREEEGSICEALKVVGEVG